MSKLYEVIEIGNGKEKIKMRGSLTKCRDRMKQLRSSRRGDNVRFEIRESLKGNNYNA